MIKLSVSLWKLSFTWLIRQSFAVHEETSVLICSLYVKCESTITPKFSALNTGLISFPGNERVVSSSFFNNWGVPITRNSVLFWLINSWLAEHHLATRQRVSSSFSLAENRSFIGVDRKALLSSMYDLRKLYYVVITGDRLYIYRAVMVKVSFLVVYAVCDMKRRRQSSTNTYNL